MLMGFEMWHTAVVVVAAVRTVLAGCSIAAAALLGRSFAVAGVLGRSALFAAGGRILAVDVGGSFAGCSLAGCSRAAGARAGLGSCRIGIVGCRSWTFFLFVSGIEDGNVGMKNALV